MNDRSAPDSPAPAATALHEPPPRPPGRLFPPAWVGVVIGVCSALIVWAHTTTPAGDHAIVNILTVVFLGTACSALVLWFALFSGYSARWRWGATAGLAAGFILFAAMFRIEHVTAELVPAFRLRWSPHRDAELARPVSRRGATADLATSTPRDFPQFLGPQRSNWIAAPALSTDWTTPPRPLWRQPIGAGWSAFAAVNGFAVTMEQRGEEELVTCYEIETGALVWSHAIPSRHETVLGGVGPRSTPTIYGGRVFALGPTGVLRCLDGVTGAPIWQENLLERYSLTPELDLQSIAWGRANSPLIVEELVVVPVGGSSSRRVGLAAFRQSDGELAWEGGDRQVSYSSPVLATLANRRQILMVNEDSVSGHDPQQGDLLWQFDWPGRSSTNASASQAVPVGTSQVFVSKGYGIGAALWELVPDSTGQLLPRQVWHKPELLKTKLANVVLRDNFAFGLSDGILECADITTGERRWKKGRYGHGQILGVGDLLLVQSESGELLLVAADPDQHRELASFQAIEGKSWNNLCLYGDRLLIRNAEEAACYVLPTRNKGSSTSP